MTKNQKTLHYFSEAFLRNKLSHAYILEGEKGSGKEESADLLAAALLCNVLKPRTPLFGNPEFSVPCGKCPSCIKAFSGNHPDIIHVRHEKDTVISVNEIREQVVSDIAIKPYYGPYKIYIIKAAQLMNENAQNALLKTIEEPAEYGIILLLTDNADGFLETIRSRCICLRMDRVPSSVKEKELLGEEGQKVLDILMRVQSMDALEINKTAKELESGDRTEIFRFLNLWIRDLLVFKSTLGRERLLFGQKADEIQRMQQNLSYEGLNRMLLDVEKAGDQLAASVKGEAVFESLLLSLRKEMNS